MPCMLPDDGMVPANAFMALGSIDEVMASWFAGRMLGVPSTSIIEPSEVIDSKILEAEESMDALWRRDDDNDDGTVGGPAMPSLGCQPEAEAKTCALSISFCARRSWFCLRR